MTARSNKCRIRVKSFKGANLVWKLIFSMEHESRTYGKWSATWAWPFHVENIFSDNAYSIVKIERGSKIYAINGKYLKSYHRPISEVQISIGP